MIFRKVGVCGVVVGVYWELHTPFQAFIAAPSKLWFLLALATLMTRYRIYGVLSACRFRALQTPTWYLQLLWVIYRCQRSKTLYTRFRVYRCFECWREDLTTTGSRNNSLMNSQKLIQETSDHSEFRAKILKWVITWLILAFESREAIDRILQLR